MSAPDRAQRSEVSRHRQRASILPNTLLLAALGVFLVAYGYVRGREELGFGTALYWAGQLLLFGVVIYRVLAPGTLQYERDVLVFAYAGAQSLLRWAYSPHRFTFMDELQHYRALQNVLDSGHLFSANYSLPVSPRYPGLENIAAEVVQVTGLGSFGSGVALAGVAHVMTAGCVLLLFRELSGSAYIASVGAVIYMLNPHASFFNTSFLYEAPALPFAILTILLTILFAKNADGRWRYFFGVLACTALVVITHHVSALATVAMLSILGVATAILRRARHLTLPIFMCAAASGLVVATWILGVAPVTIEYLGNPVRELVTSLGSFLTGTAKLSLPGPPTPLIERLIGPLGVLVTFALIAANLRRARTWSPLEECWAWLALAMYGAASTIRILVSSGAELAGRLLTYSAIFSAVVVGAALVRIVSEPSRRTGRLSGPVTRRLSALGIAFVLLVSSIVTSLPAWYQRVPGGFWIEGFGGGIDAVGLSRAQWANTHMRPGMRYSGDITAMSLMSTMAKLDPVKDPGTIYYTDAPDFFTPAEIQHIKSSGIVYSDVDLRMSQYVPIGKRYFAKDVNGGHLTEPIDIERLRKFDRIPGISRVYDSGYARMYDLRGGRNSPYAR